MRRRTGTLAAAVALSIGAGTCFFPDGGAYHGGTGLTLAATGRFRVEQVNGVFWLVTPDGHPFFSSGINNVSSNPDYEPATGRYPYHENVLARWGSETAWAEEVLRRLTETGVNTVGAWSQLSLFRGRFPYTQILGFAGGAPEIPGLGGGRVPLRDYFDPAFETASAAEAQAARACATDPYCIGVFSDNELPWPPSLLHAVPFLDAFLYYLPPGAPGKQALQAFLEDRYAGSVTALNAAWGLSLARFDEIQQVTTAAADPSHDSATRKADRMAFRGRVASRYYQVVHDALRAIDPQLLILGDRYIAFSAAADVVQAAAPWVDVISINAYEWNAPWWNVAQGLASLGGLIPAAKLLDDVDEIYRLTGKPILISEYGYRAADAGLPNSTPPVYPVLPDQKARADAYARYMDEVLARPYLVGAHWFEYADEPPTGRFDGEDDNWGFVNLQDDLYPDLALRVWSVNARLYPTRLALAH